MNMSMTPGLRKFALTAHIATSVGWLGSIAAFLALAIAALVSQDTQMVRTAYAAMDLTARSVIVPLAFASLMTGLIQSLGTRWGLCRHYWVLAKFLLTLFATVVLLIKMDLIGYAARMAAEAALPRAELYTVGIELAVHAAGGFLVLLVPTVLSVYKPRGLTPYGRRMQDEQLSPLQQGVLPSKRPDPSDESDIRPSGELITFSVPRVYLFGVIVIVLVLHFVALHLTGNGFA